MHSGFQTWKGCGHGIIDNRWPWWPQIFSFLARFLSFISLLSDFLKCFSAFCGRDQISQSKFHIKPKSVYRLIKLVFVGRECKIDFRLSLKKVKKDFPSQASDDIQVLLKVTNLSRHSNADTDRRKCILQIKLEKNFALEK